MSRSSSGKEGEEGIQGRENINSMCKDPVTGLS